MKKSVISILLALILIFTTVSTVFADEYIDGIPNDAHKVKNKWDFTGSFVASRAPFSGQTWSYSIHIKQAVYGPYSKGVIEFTHGEDVITAHVEDVKENYAYWTNSSLSPTINDNFAAAGWAEFRGEVYSFIFIYSPGAMWIVLSETPYNTAWDSGTMLSSRAYQLLSPWPPSDSIFDLDPKEIHE